MKLYFSALGALLTIASVAPAQSPPQTVLSNREIEWGLTYPGPAATGVVSQAERYSYNTGSFIYVNGDRNRMIYLDYLDRADRAAKFGYRMPVDPFFPPTPPFASLPAGAPAAEFPPAPQAVPEATVISGGGIFGFFRRR